LGQRLKPKPRKGSWIIFPLALFAFFAPVETTKAQQSFQNGSFSSTSSGWTGANGGADCSGGSPSLGEWQQNALNFSYVTSTVGQTISIDQPSEVVFSFYVQDRAETWIDGQYRVDLISGDNVVSTGIQTAPDFATKFEISINTTENNQPVTIAITGDDGPNIFWAGCYGPTFTDSDLKIYPNVNGLNLEVFEVGFDQQFEVNGEYQLCETGWTSIRNIEHNFDGYPYNGIVAGCRYDRVLLKYSGYITIPGEGEEPKNVLFQNYADDGFYLLIDNQIVINDWYWKGCSGQSGTIDLIPGEEYPFEVWFFEDGGSACSYLYWSIEGSEYEVVPFSAFRKEQSPPPPPPTTIPPTTIPETTTTSGPIVIEEKPEPVVVSTTSTSTTIPVLQTTTTTGSVNDPTTTTTAVQNEIPQPTPDEEDEVSQEKILEAVFEGKITKEIAIEAASNPEVLQKISSEQAKDIFSEINVSELSAEDAKAIVAAVQSAPESVRKAFEEEINVFDGAFDEYVPTGSNVDVATRRVIVAATTVLTTVGVSISHTGSSGSSPGSPGSSGGPGGNSGGNNSSSNSERRRK